MSRLFAGLCRTTLRFPRARKLLWLRLLVGVIALIAPLAIHAGAALAANNYYFSSSNGFDSNPCTQTGPCQSLSKAGSLSLNPGDNVLFKAGDTWTGGLVLNHSGSSSGGRITVEPYGSGAKPKFNGGNGGDCIKVNASFYTITSIETDSCGYAGTEVTGTDTTVEQMYATGNSVGIWVNSGTSNVLITGNELVNNNILNVNNQASSSGAFGVLLNGTAVVTNNTIHGDYARSLASGYGGWDGSGVEVYNASNTWVHNNLLYDNDNEVELGGNGSGNTIEYNVMYSDPMMAAQDQRTSGIVLPGSVTGTRISHNSIDVTGNTSEGIVCYSNCAGNDAFTSNAVAATTAALDTDNGSASVTGNVFNGTIRGTTLDNTNSTATIGWVSPPSNLHETVGSPTVDHATVTNVSTDFDGNPVPDVAGTQSDSGAYEFRESPPVVVTGSAGSVGSGSAVVSGSVNPSGLATTYRFEYGTSTKYGSQAPGPPDPSAGSGTSSVSVSVTLSGLLPLTTYHYRLVATNASGTTDGSDQTFTTGSVQGSWVGVYGSGGFDLAAFGGGGGDVATLPGASVSLVQGSRYVWAQGTSDVRALQSVDQSSRVAATYYDPSQVQVQLSFSSPYTGSLELYALDWDSTARRETITVAGGGATQSATLGGDFSQGAWVSFSLSNVSVVTITVARTAGANAVLSGIFLGGAGSPATYPSSPQGSWVGGYGSGGYDLAAFNGSGDESLVPGASLSVTQGSRYVWASGTSDARALQSVDKSTRAAAAYYDPNQLQVQLSFSSSYTGSLQLYALDWDSTARRETITVAGGGGTQTASLASDFSQGAWVGFQLTNASAVTITVTRDGGANAVLSGIFVGGAGNPPTYPSSPQGNWVGAYGSGGYDLAAFSGSSDASVLPGATLTLAQGSRYVWASGTTDARALQSVDKSTRTAATYYDPNQVQVQLSFNSPYTGSLELYALDWDSTARRETITVNGQTATLASDFSQGAWLTFQLNNASTATITATRNNGANAVLSGIFLGGTGNPPP